MKIVSLSLVSFAVWFVISVVGLFIHDYYKVGPNVFIGLAVFGLYTYYSPWFWLVVVSTVICCWMTFLRA